MTLSSEDETIPPQSPCFDEFVEPSTGIPSLHHVILAGGLLELESQNKLASAPGLSSSGSILILTVSGATIFLRNLNFNSMKLKKFD